MGKEKIANLRNWGHTIKNYSKSYEDTMMGINEKVRKSLTSKESQKEFQLNIEKSQMKKKILLEKSPCIQLKTHFRGHENRLVEVIVNEKFLEMIGYAIEQFISIVLSEGLPRIVPLKLVSNSNHLKNILEFFALNKDLECSTPEYETQILTKNGYIKDVKSQVHFFSSYEDGKCGSDTLFTFSDYEFSNLQSKYFYFQSLNQEFIDAMISRENHTKDFLLSFYNSFILPEYTNIHKTCTIRDLIKEEDDFI